VTLFTSNSYDKKLKVAFERKQISDLVGLLEKIVDANIGASGDRAGTFNNSNILASWIATMRPLTS
jgi:hypothetical protein